MSRSLSMDCDKGKNNLFSLKANLAHNFNTISGKIKNFNSNLFLKNWLNKNFNFLKIDFNSQFNGSYTIQTNKDFDLESINFISDESILISNNNEDKKFLKTKLSGSLSWKKKNNILEFSDITMGDEMVAFGEIDLISKKGSSNLLIKKILVEDTKIYLSKFVDLYNSNLESNFIKNLNNYRGGNLKNLSVNIKFSLLKKLS